MSIDEQNSKIYTHIAIEYISYFISKALGEQGLSALMTIVETVVEIFKNFDYESFSEIIVLTGLNTNDNIICDKDIIEILNIEDISNQKGSKICIEVKNDGRLLILLDKDIELRELKKNSLLYYYKRKDNQESFEWCDGSQKLTDLSPGSTYFAADCYNSLDETLQAYRNEIKYSSKLNNIWYDPERMYLNSKPEAAMRDSLADFINIRLRGVGRAEITVDGSKPVDIEVMFPLRRRFSIIEVKWLGKSFKNDKETTTYSDSRAQDGAKQLYEYLISDRQNLTSQIIRAYLVVFDARRKYIDKPTQKDIFYFENKEITYDPDYSNLDSDFCKPLRFYLAPILRQ